MSVIASFIVWTIIMVGLVVVMFIMSRRSKAVDERFEQTASTVLPYIGQIAEKHHRRKHGPDSIPPNNGHWYTIRHKARRV